MARHAAWATASSLLLCLAISTAVTAEEELDRVFLQFSGLLGDNTPEYRGQHFVVSSKDQWQDESRDAIFGLQNVQAGWTSDDDDMEEQFILQFLQRPVTPYSLSHQQGASYGWIPNIFAEDPLDIWIERQLPVFTEVFGQQMFPLRPPAMWRHFHEDGMADFDEEEDTIRCLGVFSQTPYRSGIVHTSSDQQHPATSLRAGTWAASGDAAAEAYQLDMQPDYVGVEIDTRDAALRSKCWVILGAALLAAALSAAGCYCCTHCSCTDTNARACYPYSVVQPLLGCTAAPATPERPIVVAANHADYSDMAYVPLKGEQ